MKVFKLLLHAGYSVCSFVGSDFQHFCLYYIAHINISYLISLFHISYQYLIFHINIFFIIIVIHCQVNFLIKQGL